MFIQVLKSLTAAFSIYSKIPVPRFKWASDDMKYHLCFFPWVGAVIGAVEWGWFNLFFKVLAGHGGLSGEKGHLFFSLIALVIPVIISGGFHIDGFLDTMDALHSYADRNKKLEILKDPHIGAFAVISLAVYLLLAAAFISLIDKDSASEVTGLCFSFFLSRCLSGLSVLIFPKAKKEGMIAAESGTKKRAFVITILCIQFAAAAMGLVYLTGLSGLLLLFAMLLSFVYYFFMSGKHFGGITGDTAGFYVCLSELTGLIAFDIICFVR